MNHLLRSFNLNVDLAVEARDLIRGTADREIQGVEERVEHLEQAKITTMTIKTEPGAQSMGRPIGTYVTIESPPLKINDPYVKEDIIAAMSKSMPYLTNNALQPNDMVLLVGLGNWRATADSLGPKFIQYSPITRHYHQYAPDALVDGMRPTCGMSPGVLGITGLETFDIVKGVVDRIKPALLIVVDALAAQNVERIGTTIQMGNTGIQPGGGIGNARHALTQATLGAPVIAIGCPTIVNAAVITNQAIRQFCATSGAVFNELTAAQAIKEILSYFGGTMTVTPKEIDDIIENSSRIIAMDISASVFPGISQEQLQLYTT